MKTRQGMDARSAPHFGSVAVVSYLPGPLGPFLTSLRRGLDPENNPEAHITFLPPRQIGVKVEAASEQVAGVVHAVEPFGVELGCVNVFPETHILYLNILAGYTSFLKLHSCLNQGGLLAEEKYEFVPHLTLSGPLSEGKLYATMKRAEDVWSASVYSNRFDVEELTLLWQPGEPTERDWTRRSSHRLLRVDRSAPSQT